MLKMCMDHLFNDVNKIGQGSGKGKGDRERKTSVVKNDYMTFNYT